MPGYARPRISRPFNITAWRTYMYVVYSVRTVHVHMCTPELYISLWCVQEPREAALFACKSFCRIYACAPGKSLSGNIASAWACLHDVRTVQYSTSLHRIPQALFSPFPNFLANKHVIPCLFLNAPINLYRYVCMLCMYVRHGSPPIDKHASKWYYCPSRIVAN